MTVLLTLNPGMIPYFELTADDSVLSYVCSGGRLLQRECALSCPDPLWALLERCWADGARDRPSFAELGVLLGLVALVTVALLIYSTRCGCGDGNGC